MVKLETELLRRINELQVVMATYSHIDGLDLTYWEFSIKLGIYKEILALLKK